MEINYKWCYSFTKQIVSYNIILDNIFIEDNCNDDITTLHMACYNGS